MTKTAKICILAALVAVILIVAGVVYYVTMHPALPADITFSNGRIEAQTIDIATRNGGRILDVPVEEGGLVKEGDIVAKLDLDNIAASVAGAEANARSAGQQRDAANSLVDQASSALVLAQKEFDRVRGLVASGAVSHSRYDLALNQKESAASSLAAAKQRLAAANDAVDAAQAEVARLTNLLSDRDMKAPRAGRILYKLVQPGEVVPAGGRVVTLVDLSDVYMTCFFATDVVGKLVQDDEARIVLDALPDVAIPATISYISPEAQFTPRQVETKTEREKLTFRVKVRIPAALLQKHMDQVKTGLPGVAYVRTNKNAVWPAFLTVRSDILRDASEK